ncbi:hypothetical protein KSP40_PGU020955 [Platanthera guangdongensis]|uniref:Uncharacterized protein n=1 Tax=Platanthera guangdongensis TaxID=2320717 RepID=A0ABR2LZC3_9ASPA
MAVEVARAYYFQWPQTPRLPTHCAFSPKSLSAFSSNSSDRAIAHAHRIGHRVSFLGAEVLLYSDHKRRARGGRRGVSVSTTSSLDGFVNGDKDEAEFVKMINELDLKFKLEGESRINRDAGVSNSNDAESDFSASTSPPSSTDEILALQSNLRPTCDQFSPEKVDRRANHFDLPISLRILKRKRKRWEIAVMNNYACCSVVNAFSSMVFIFQEILTHTIHMREALISSSNLQNQGILFKAHDEVHASFIWLFQHIFSATPNLMVYLILLLANFTVFSITQYPAISPPPSQPVSMAVEESENPSIILNDSAAANLFLIARSLFAGGSCGGVDDGKVQAIAGAADDDDGWDLSLTSFCTGRSISSDVLTTVSEEEEYATAWKRILQEADRIRRNERPEALMDPDTLRRFVSPVTVELEPEDFSAYSATELSYRRAVAENPEDPLILSNFAQFLYLVLRDHCSAEEYFKRAAEAAPADAEALCRYANFLWAAKADLEAAEETFLAAIAVDPGNSCYSANYAHFLWSTGGRDTCYPLEKHGGA